MKILIITLLISFSSALFSQESATGHTQAGTAIGRQNLTDEERHQSDTFIHQASADRIVQEECLKVDGGRACQGQGTTKFGAIGGVISKAYTTFIGSTLLTGAKGGDSKKYFEKKEQAPGEKGKGSKDYCQYIPIGTELGAAAMQKITNEQIASVPDQTKARQSQELYKAARTHKERARIHTIQAAGWGATAACYTFYLASPTFKFPKSAIVKLAGSTLLAGFFASEAKTHSKYSKQVKAVADKLPGAGDCNPITETQCFCSKEESQAYAADYTKYCLPALANQPGNPASPVTCVNRELQSDPSCQCKLTNSCFSERISSAIQLDLFPQQFLNSSEWQGFQQATNGDISGVNITNASLGKNIARNPVLKKADSILTSQSIPNLSPAQKIEADSLAKLGLPLKLSSKLASLPTTPASSGYEKSLFSGVSGSKVAVPTYRKKSRNGNVWNYNSAPRKRSKRSSRTNSSPNFLARLKNKKSKKPSNQKVWAFSKKAQEKAEITRQTGRPLFDIISRRYQVSGVPRLELDQ